MLFLNSSQVCNSIQSGWVGSVLSARLTKRYGTAMQNQDNKTLSNEESRRSNLVEKKQYRYVFVQTKCGLTLLHGQQLGLPTTGTCL